MRRHHDTLVPISKRLEAVERLIKIKEEKIEGIQARLDYELLDLSTLKTEKIHLQTMVNSQFLCHKVSKT